METHSSYTQYADNSELWEAVLAQIQFHISQTNFATWFRNTHISAIEDGTVVIAVPNKFSKEWLENKYHAQLLHIIRQLRPDIRDISYAVDPSDTPAVDRRSP